MKFNIIIIGLLMISSMGYSQTGISSVKEYSLRSSEDPAISLTTISIGLGVLLYLVNPVMIYEDNKLYVGITKEFSVGFGKLGQHRFGIEYSSIFRGNVSHHLRFAYKYDVLLNDKIKPSNNLQGTSVLSPGAGYFTNFSKQGFFPELAFGYSLRNHKILIYPHIKIRYTFMFKKTDTNISDISFGIILGLANPFMDVKIRRNN